jgi:SAM-dependent methyltransferase
VDKRSFYRRGEISAGYDQQRFGGASGARVNRREIAIVLNMLPVEGRVLDLACGTGRLSQAIALRGQGVTAADYSPAMAIRTAALGVSTTIADAFCTPFADGSFQAVVSVRFAFHYEDLSALLAEMRRVTADGGILIFDTYSWSPRALAPFGARRWGGKVCLHRPTDVMRTAERLGLRVERTEPCFLFSPYLYRLAPLAMERAFEYAERLVPRSLLCRVFWRLRR